MQCYTDIPVSPTETASITYDFSIQFVDLWGNEHYLTMTDDIVAGMKVSVTAVYVNHDNWPSPIGVLDDPDW